MAYINFKTSDYFANRKYSGTGSSQTISTGFQPDVSWSKALSHAYSNRISNSASGFTKSLITNATDAEATDANVFSGTTSDGITVGSDAGTNVSGGTFINRSWKMGTTSGISGGTITPSSYSISTVAKQGVYKYAGNGTAGATVPHGLGAVPSLIIVKKLNATSSWMVYHTSQGATKVGYLNDVVGFGNGTAVWNSVEPTTTLITLGTDGDVNASGSTYIMYVYCNVDGFFKAGTYVGNGNVDGTYVHLGFRPSFVFQHGANMSSSGWYSEDSANEGYNDENHNVGINYGNTEDTETPIRFLAQGMQYGVDYAGGSYNLVSEPFVYAAWAEYPSVGSNGTVGVAR